jgi:hypothetical protein
MLVLLFLSVLLTSNNNLVAKEKWGEYQVSDKNQLSLQNAIHLAVGVLEHPENIAPSLTEKCKEREAAKETRSQICSSENIERLQEVISQGLDLEDIWLSKSISVLPNTTDNWQNRFPECNQDIDEKNQAIQEINSWLNEIGRSPPQSRKKFKKRYRDRFVKDFVPSIRDVQQIKTWCKGESPPPSSNSMPILLATAMLTNFGMTKNISKFCKTLARYETKLTEGSNEEVELIRDFLVTTSENSDLLKYSYEQMEKGKFKENNILRDIKYNVFATVQNNQFNSSLSYLSFPKKKIKEKISQMTNGSCDNSDIYYHDDENGRYCACYQKKIKESYANVAREQSFQKKDKLERLLGDMYTEMIKKSGLSKEDQVTLLEKNPAPPVEILSAGVWQGYYTRNSNIPPFNPGLIISPGMIDKFDDPKYRDYIMGTLTHELGHHIFSSIYETKGFNLLSLESKNNLTEFNDCIDQTTIEREIIPGLRGELIDPTCTHVGGKRSELGADLFSSALNASYSSADSSWDRVKSSAYLCTYEHDEVKITDDKQREKFFKIISHTEPISRAQIYLDPPRCSTDFWSN